MQLFLRFTQCGNESSSVADSVGLGDPALHVFDSKGDRSEAAPREDPHAHRSRDAMRRALC